MKQTSFVLILSYILFQISTLYKCQEGDYLLRRKGSSCVLNVEVFEEAEPEIIIQLLHLHT